MGDTPDMKISDHPEHNMPPTLSQRGADMLKVLQPLEDKYGGGMREAQRQQMENASTRFGRK